MAHEGKQLSRLADHVIDKVRQRDEHKQDRRDANDPGRPRCSREPPSRPPCTAPPAAEAWEALAFSGHASFAGKQGTITKRVALTIFYLDSAGFAGFMKADNEDNGKALKSLGLAK
jgi:hypothetical protein